MGVNYGTWNKYLEYLNQIVFQDKGIKLFNGGIIKYKNFVYYLESKPELGVFGYSDGDNWYDTVMIGGCNGFRCILDYTVNKYNHLGNIADFAIRYFNSLASCPYTEVNFISNIQLVLVSNKGLYNKWFKHGFKGLDFRSKEVVRNTGCEKLKGSITGYITEGSGLVIPRQFTNWLNFNRFHKDKNVCLGIRLGIIATNKITSEINFYPVFVERDSKWFNFLLDLVESSKDRTSVGVFVREYDVSTKKYYNASIGDRRALKSGLCSVIGSSLCIEELLKDSFILPR